ncbi:MAG: hypothetical protein AVDCRST_MAG90-2610, partial [uncultured Microvirga sp.]
SVSADRRQVLDRGRVRPLSPAPRPCRQGRGGVRDHGRRQAGALARPLRRDRARDPHRNRGVQHSPLARLRGHGGLARRQIPLSAARRPALGRRQEGLGEDHRGQGGSAHPRIRRRGRKMDRPALDIRARSQRPRHRRLQHDRRGDGADHRTRQRRGHRRQGLPVRPEAPRLFSRHREIQARGEGRDERPERRRRRAQDRAYRPDADRGPEPEGEEAADRRGADVPVLHHRECRRGRRPPYRGRQRQQPALLDQPRAEQGRRQRVRAARGRGLLEGAL